MAGSQVHYECDAHTRVESLPAPIGRVVHDPVDSHTYLREKLRAISVPAGVDTSE
ncbi:hypothetical protein ABZY34_24020 [Streptomyces virginiae]|uniref:hypothetical protein n=1 Tax=Streptomyces virginiae TaxID=1961 RepID=UPI0033B0A95A